MHGFGLEIGALHKPFDLDATVIYLDCKSKEELLEQYKNDAKVSRIKHVHLKAPGDSFPFICSNIFDFVCSCHVLQYLSNPGRAIEEWLRVLKPGGLIYIIVPDKRYCFDRRRETTTIEHLIDEYTSNIREISRLHYEDYIINTNGEDGIKRETSETFIDRCFNAQSSIHVHTFTADSLYNFLLALKEHILFEVIHYEAQGLHLHVALKKKAHTNVEYASSFSTSGVVQLESIVDYSSPIISIGAGRSGSTLLAGMLDHHPQISFGFETNFIAWRLWREFFGPKADVLSSFVDWRFKHEVWHKNKRGIAEPSSTRSINKFVKQEEARIGQIIAKAVHEALGLDPSAKHWGYKEIWNGLKITGPVDWRIYDLIFPRATWVHLIRNPVDFAISRAKGDISKFSIGGFSQHIKDWVTIVQYSRLRRVTERYFEFRYEDLVNNPQKVLAPLVKFLEIEWIESIMGAFDIGYCRSEKDITCEVLHIIKGIELDVPGLYNLAKELGYLERMNKIGIRLR